MVAGGTARESSPEVWELLYHFRIVADGSTEVASLIKEARSIEDCHDILWLDLQHVVEVFYRPIVVTNLLA